jgi:TolB-like protein/class 3 adenylate cyclase/Flp pilus assembly protein TadD
MPAQLKPERHLEIAHVLFIDVVDYSRLLVNEQRDVVEQLNEIVRGTAQFQESDAAGKLIRIPSGDGMALVFFQSPEEPVQCAIEIANALRGNPKFQVRMGIHSGAVDEVTHVDDRANVAGAGINIAQRVMDCGDAGHILLSRRAAEDLAQDARWQPHLHDLGEIEVKHVRKIGIFSLYNDEVGNHAVPTRLRQQTHRRRNVMLLAAAAIALAAIIAIFVMPRASADKIDKSIAVLPFENLSDDKENAFFADGVQDDVLTNLSKIGDLKVISRTSVMQYKGKTNNVREIGKALGVSNILEGSVRRAGNRVRVNVQLIDATMDKHLWANDYDRDLTDVFAIQTELAHDIANQLQAKLSDSEKAMMAHKPTENGEAYLSFIQAHNLFNTGIEDTEKLKQSEQLYARAIALDPKFALALARYSQLESWFVHSVDRTPERIEKARAMAERAVQLQPDSPEAHLALGFSHYYVDNDYDAALKEFEIAQRGLPNESEAYLALGAIQRRQGKWAESNANLEKAAALSPKDPWILQNLAFNYGMLRNYDAANKTVDRALQMKPDGFGLWEIKVNLAISERGDLSVGERALEKAKSMPIRNNEERLRLAKARVDFLLFRRKYPEVLETLEGLPDELFSSMPEVRPAKYLVIGIARKQLGDEADARTAFLKAKNICEEQLKQKPDDASLRVGYAKVLAWLGEKDAAVAEAQRATELRPESKDAFEGPAISAQVAEVYAVLGDHARAIEILDGLLNRPSELTVPNLKLNPAWDPLRNDPKFQALLARHGEKIAGK